MSYPLNLSLTEVFLRKVSQKDEAILVSFLSNVFDKESIQGIYKQSSLEYQKRLSARYALNTVTEGISRDENAMKAYSLWLAMTWIVDGVFDGCPESVTSADQHFIRRVVKGEDTNFFDNEKGKESANSPRSTNPLVNSVLSTFRNVYALFLSMTKNYKQSQPSAWRLYEETYISFIDTLIGEKSIVTEQEYRSWRIRSGAIPCVLWQLCLYSGVPPEQIPMSLVDDVSCVVSYHNDLLSVDRDLANGTLSVVSVIAAESASTLPDAYSVAVHIINLLYDKIDAETRGKDIKIQEIVDACVIGSFVWTNKEERYDVGLNLLRKYNEGVLGEADIGKLADSYGKDGKKSAGEA